MENYLQAVGAVLLSVILILALKAQGKDIGAVLALFVCCGLACLALQFVQPIVDFLSTLQQIGSIDSQMYQILLKVVATALIGEIASQVCVDSGNGGIAKALQILTTTVILRLSLPMINAVLNLLKELMEKI